MSQQKQPPGETRPPNGANKAPAASAGVLNSADIEREIDNQRLMRGADKNLIQACSYDMRIGTIFKDGRPITGPQTQGNEVQVQPGEIISLFTQEELALPADIMATAFAINSMSSQGLLVLNPGHVDPGFVGPLTVRAINIRKTPKAINLGTKIFTVIFERLPTPTPTPYNRNVSRQEREIEFNAMDLEQNPKSLTSLVFEGKDHPFITAEAVDEKIRNYVTGEKVNRQIISGADVDNRIKDFVTAEKVDSQIRNYWATWVIFVASLIAAVAAIIAVWQGFTKDKSNQAFPTPTPSVQSSVPPDNRGGNASSPAASPLGSPSRNTNQ
jgi:deoxycytidine triphosphate deaminase